MPTPKLTVPVLAAALLAVAPWLAGCQSDDEVRISPVPAGYAALLRQQEYQEGSRNAFSEGGRTVDELLAVVDGEYLTRREILRSLRITQEDIEEDPNVEEEILDARLRWAQQRLIMGAARRAGIRIPPSAVDDIVERKLAQEMKENAEESGETLTQEAYLAARDLTYAEYRAETYGAVVAEIYMRKLYQGISGTRPYLDYEVSPAEVRRIYFDHRDKFDLPAGAKLVIFQIPLERFEREGRDFLEAEEAANVAARRLAQAFGAGAEPKALAAQFDLPKGNWQITPDFVAKHPLPAVNDWMFEAGRKPRDARVFRDQGGPIVLGILEVRGEKRRTLSDPEVYDLIVQVVQGARLRHLQAKLTVDLLERGGVVWPDELADELLDDAQRDLDMIASHEIVKRARLR